MISTPSDPAVKAAPAPVMRPWLFLLGFAVGLALLAVAGAVLAHRHSYPNFTRFAVRISPEGNYYPTLDEMCQVVRERMKPGKILVIVGGNSIFHGVGQPADRLWTGELQRLLGDRFVVVNLALRGATFTDGGAVVAEVLRREFPQLLYVANTSPWSPPHPAGVEPYTYLLREARARGLMDDIPAREALLSDHRRRAVSWAETFEQWGVAYSDRVLRYRDFWNWVGFNRVFTVPSKYTPSGPLATAPRRELADEEPDFDSFPWQTRFNPAVRENEMEIVRGFSRTYCEPDEAGGWRLRAGTREYFLNMARAALPDDLKRRTLVMLSHNSPYYVRQLSPAEQARNEFAYASSLAAWREAGYHARAYGANFAEADFGDRTHLTVSGGRKLAAEVAVELASIARELNYLH